jgi:hypothetical protein
MNTPKNTPKTSEEVKAEVAKLREMKPNIRHRTSFGDDNWAAIDAQIKVLEEGMDEDEIWDEWPEDEEDMHERDSAREALAWNNGDKDSEAPSDTWRSLTRPQ